jgi:hypothetical protein
MGFSITAIKKIVFFNHFENLKITALFNKINPKLTKKMFLFAGSKVIVQDMLLSFSINYWNYWKSSVLADLNSKSLPISNYFFRNNSDEKVG